MLAGRREFPGLPIMALAVQERAGAGVSGRNYVPPTKQLDAAKVTTRSGYPGVILWEITKIQSNYT